MHVTHASKTFVRCNLCLLKVTMALLGRSLGGIFSICSKAAPLQTLATNHSIITSCYSGLNLSGVCSTSSIGDGPWQQASRSVSMNANQNSLEAPSFAVGLFNLRDNPGAVKQSIRVGRGDAARRGNYCGRGMKGQKARGKAHVLYDGGQLGLIKFPVVRQQPPYEVLYFQLGLSRLLEYIQLGLLNPASTITMKDLQDCGCVGREIKYGVRLYGKSTHRIGFPINIEVSACDDGAKAAVEAAGGKITRVYYSASSLQGLLHPEHFTSKNLPLPQPAHSWHPKHEGKFDVVGKVPGSVPIPMPPTASQQKLSGTSASK